MWSSILDRFMVSCCFLCALLKLSNAPQCLWCMMFLHVQSLCLSVCHLSLLYKLASCDMGHENCRSHRPHDCVQCQSRNLALSLQCGNMICYSLLGPFILWISLDGSLCRFRHTFGDPCSSVLISLDLLWIHLSAIWMLYVTVPRQNDIDNM